MIVTEINSLSIRGFVGISQDDSYRNERALPCPSAQRLEHIRFKGDEVPGDRNFLQKPDVEASPRNVPGSCPPPPTSWCSRQHPHACSPGSRNEDSNTARSGLIRKREILFSSPWGHQQAALPPSTDAEIIEQTPRPPVCRECPHPPAPGFRPPAYHHSKEHPPRPQARRALPRSHPAPSHFGWRPAENWPPAWLRR